MHHLQNPSALRLLTKVHSDVFSAAFAPARMKATSPVTNMFAREGVHAQLDIGAQYNALTRVIVSSARAEAVRIRAARVRECKHHTPRNCGRKELAEPRKETEKAAEPAHTRGRGAAVKRYQSTGERGIGILKRTCIDQSK